MGYLKSTFLNLMVYGWSTVLVLLLWVFLPFPRMAMVRAFHWWTGSLVWMLDHFLGIKYEIRGLENLPKETAILASKHQSTWDTLFFYTLIDDPAYVLKKELLSIPLYGWYLRKCNLIAVDRDARASALKHVIKETNAALESGRTVVIFPEGTRTVPGQKVEYQPGIAAMYKSAARPVVPIALNSGCFWGRRDFLKRPGKIVVEILPPIQPGLKPRDFLGTLATQIEEASERLRQEAEEQFLLPDKRGDN